MKKILLLVFITISIQNVQLYSQSIDSVKVSDHNHYLGINAGFTTGVGFAYRYMGNKSGIQLAMLPLYDENNTYVSIGASYLRVINSYNDVKFLAYAGNHYTNFFNDDKTYSYNIGGGFGFDFSMRNIVVNIMIGYAFIDILDNFKTRPVVEFGLLYRF